MLPCTSALKLKCRMSSLLVTGGRSYFKFMQLRPQVPKADSSGVLIMLKCKYFKYYELKYKSH